MLPRTFGIFVCPDVDECARVLVGACKMKTEFKVRYARPACATSKCAGDASRSMGLTLTKSVPVVLEPAGHGISKGQLALHRQWQHTAISSRESSVGL